MRMISRIFVMFAALAMASTKKKGDDSYLSVLSKERQELKEMFRHENNQLREQDTKLQRENDQIRKRVEELQEQIVKMRDEKLQEENNMLKKEIEKLRHADRRARNQIDKLALEKKMKKLIRQEDVALKAKTRQSKINSSLKKKETISEVEITGGSASATSIYDNYRKPEKALIRGDPKSWGWISGTDPKNNGVYPQMIWYDFGHGNAFVPARVTFRGLVNCGGCQVYTPSVWEFVGSNDDVCSQSGNWTILCQDYSDVKQHKDFETKICDVHDHNNQNTEQGEYRCLGINVIRADAYTGLSNLRMWRNAIQMGDMKNATQFELK